MVFLVSTNPVLRPTGGRELRHADSASHVA